MRKKAIITGGESGIGRGISLALAKEGYDIAFSYYSGAINSEYFVEKTIKDIEALGAKCYSYDVDLSVPNATDSFFKEAVEMPFEDITVPIPVGYDRYMTMEYGDYMTPPPDIEMNLSAPANMIVDFDKPYTYYLDEANAK